MFSIFISLAGRDSFSKTTSPLWLLLKELKKIGPSHNFSNSFSCSFSNLVLQSIKQFSFEFLSLLINCFQVLNSLVILLQFQTWTLRSPLFNPTLETSTPTCPHYYTPLGIPICIFLYIFT